MAKRLTQQIFIEDEKENKIGHITRNGFEWFLISNSSKQAAMNKLGMLEDIMEKYDIEDLEQLDIMLFCLSSETKFQLKQLQKLYKKYKIKNVEELDKKLADSDTWKRACELACEELQFYDYGNEKTEDGIKMKGDYFYQQAKKEGEKI